MAGQPDLITPGISTHEARVTIPPGGTAGLPWFDIWALPDSHSHELRTFGPGEALVGAGIGGALDLNFNNAGILGDGLVIDVRYASMVSGMWVAREIDKTFYIDWPTAKTYSIITTFSFQHNARWVQFKLINVGAGAITDLDYVVSFRAVI